MAGFIVATNNVKKRNASNTGWISRALALTFTGDIIQYNKSIEPTSVEDMLERSDSRTLMSLFVEQKHTGKHISKVKVIDKIDVPELVIISAEKTLRLQLPSMQVKERWLAAFRLCLSQLNSGASKPGYEYAPDNLPHYDHRGTGSHDNRQHSAYHSDTPAHLGVPGRGGGLVRRMTGHFEEPLLSSTNGDKLNGMISSRSVHGKELITVRNMQFQFQQKHSTRSMNAKATQKNDQRQRGKAKPSGGHGRRSRSGNSGHHSTDDGGDDDDSDGVNDYDDGDYSDDAYDSDDDGDDTYDDSVEYSRSGSRNKRTSNINLQGDYSAVDISAGSVSIASQEGGARLHKRQTHSSTSLSGLSGPNLETIHEDMDDAPSTTSRTQPGGPVGDYGNRTSGYSHEHHDQQQQHTPTIATSDSKHALTSIAIQMVIAFLIVTCAFTLGTQSLLRSLTANLNGQLDVPPISLNPSTTSTGLPSIIAVAGHTYRFNSPNNRIISHAQLLQRIDHLSDILNQAYSPPAPFNIDMFMMLDGFTKEAFHAYQLYSNSNPSVNTLPPFRDPADAADTSTHESPESTIDHLAKLEKQLLTHLKVYTQIYHKYFKPYADSGSSGQHNTFQIQYNHNMSRYDPILKAIAARYSNPVTYDEDQQQHLADINHSIALILNSSIDTTPLEDILQGFHTIMTKTLPQHSNPPLSSLLPPSSSSPSSNRYGNIDGINADFTSNIIPFVLTTDQFDEYSLEYNALVGLRVKLEMTMDASMASAHQHNIHGSVDGQTPSMSRPGAPPALHSDDEESPQSLFTLVLTHSYVPNSKRVTFLIYTLFAMVILSILSYGWTYQDDVMELLMSSFPAQCGLAIGIFALLLSCVALFNAIRTTFGILACITWLSPCIYLFFTPLTEWLTPSSYVPPSGSSTCGEYGDSTYNSDAGSSITGAGGLYPGGSGGPMAMQDVAPGNPYKERSPRKKRRSNRSASQERPTSQQQQQQQQQQQHREETTQDDSDPIGGRRRSGRRTRSTTDHSLSPAGHARRDRGHSKQRAAEEKDSQASSPQMAPMTDVHASMAITLKQNHPRIKKSPPIPKKYPLFSPILPDHHLAYLQLLHKKFPFLLQTTDYAYRREIWKDIGVYEEVKVQENTEVNANRQGGGLLARGRRIMPIPPAQVMALLWDTSTKKYYDSMVDNVVVLEHINNHTKIERQIYKGKGVVSNRYLHVLAGWQHVIFHQTPASSSEGTTASHFTSDYFTQPTVCGSAPSANAAATAGPNYNNTWFYKTAELFNMYDNNTHVKQIHRPAPFLPPNDLKAHLQNAPTHSPEGYEYTSDGFAMLAMTLPNYKQPPNTPAPDPSHVEAVLNLGGFLIRGVKIPLAPQYYSKGQTINEKETKKLVQLLPTTSKLYKDQEHTNGGRFIYGCEVVGCGDISLNGLANFIQKHVCKSSPGLMTGGMQYLLKEKVKEKGNVLLVDCIDVDYFYA